MKSKLSGYYTIGQNMTLFWTNTAPRRNQGQGVLTITPVMLDPQGQGCAWEQPPPLQQQQ